MLLTDTAQNALKIIPACLLCLLIAACHEQREQSAEDADTGTEKVFRIGIVPEVNIFSQKIRYEPLMDYLSRKVGIKFTFHTLVSYENIIQEIETNNLDASFMGSFTAAVSIKRIGTLPIARIQYPDGSSTYNGLIFARNDSHINSAQDMKGKSFAFVDRATSAGWLFPMHYFAENGIGEPLEWLDDVYYTGTHEDTILDVLNKEADIGAAKDTVYRSLAASNRRIENELTVLATSPPFPSISLCVCPKTDEGIKNKLQQALLGMHLDKEGQQALQSIGAAKFIETSEKDFLEVFKYADDLGIDLATFYVDPDLAISHKVNNFELELAASHK